MKGLIAWIYRNGSDCSNGGISSRCDKDVVVGPDIPEIFEASEDMPAVKIVKRVIAGSLYVHAEPLTWRESDEITGMAGGTFIYSTDSRFRECVNEYPVSLHDRGETQEIYDRLSR